MKRLALTALALASTALSGAVLADDYYDQGNNRYGYENSDAYSNASYPNDTYSRNYSNDGGVRYDTARVLSVDPIIDQYYSQSRRECWVVSSRSGNRYGNRYNNGRYYGNSYNRRYNNGIGNNTSAVLGGVLGAAIGNHVGSGDGRRAATAVGAVLGYAIARDAQHDNRRYSNNGYNYRNDRYGNGYYTEPNGQLRCRMVNDDNYGYGYQSSRYDNGNDYRYGRDRYINERYQDRYDHDRYDNRYDDARVTGYRVTFEYHGQTYTTTTDYHPGSNIRVRVNVTADGSGIGYNDRYSDRDSRYSLY